mgnify:CR=1 FL=1|jgi:hypothetical protein|tara:strand:+ start:374 stop:640 length:267 start_codon:yes stop_codon:yes gene_type:complete
MTNVVELPKKEEGKFAVTYITNEENKIVGVSHPEWPFSIQRSENGSGNEIALVSDDGDPFGILDREVFNTILICWLLIDQPDAIADEQ